jgi:hypothetical protein
MRCARALYFGIVELGPPWGYVRCVWEVVEMDMNLL